MSATEQVRLADCCEIVAGATPSTSEDSYWGGSIAWATPKDLSDLDSKYIGATPQTLTKKGYASCSAKMMPPQSVLFSSRAPIGHVAINTVPMCTNQGFKSFVPDRDRVSPDYLYYWLKANKVYLQSLGNGATFKEVSKAIVAEIKVPLPPLPEQRRIASILDKADALRAKRREAIAKLDQLLQSVFLEMFGDPLTNPKGWPVVSMLSLTKGKYGIKAGPFGSALKKEFYTSGGYRVYGQEQVIAGTLDVGNYYIDQERFDGLKSCAVDSGDLLISLVGSFGKILVVPEKFEPGIINPRLLKLTPDRDKASPEFLKHYFQIDTLQRHLDGLSHGGTMGILNASLIKQLPVPIPPMAEQKRFVRFLEARGRQSSYTTSFASRMDHLVRSLQQLAFSDRLAER